MYTSTLDLLSLFHVEGGKNVFWSHKCASSPFISSGGRVVSVQDDVLALTLVLVPEHARAPAVWSMRLGVIAACCVPCCISVITNHARNLKTEPDSIRNPSSFRWRRIRDACCHIISSAPHQQEVASLNPGSRHRSSRERNWRVLSGWEGFTLSLSLLCYQKTALANHGCMELAYVKGADSAVLLRVLRPERSM